MENKTLQSKINELKIQLGLFHKDNSREHAVLNETKESIPVLPRYKDHITSFGGKGVIVETASINSESASSTSVSGSSVHETRKSSIGLNGYDLVKDRSFLLYERNKKKKKLLLDLIRSEMMY